MEKDNFSLGHNFYAWGKRQEPAQYGIEGALAMVKNGKLRGEGCFGYPVHDLMCAACRKRNKVGASLMWGGKEPDCLYYVVFFMVGKGHH